MGKWLVLGILMSITNSVSSASIVETEDLITAINPKVISWKARYIIRSAHQYGVAFGIDPKLLLAIIAVESKFNTRAVGRAGEVGLTQLRPEYHGLAYGDIETRTAALFGVDENIATAAKYLYGLKEVFSAKYSNYRWVEFYNCGPNKRPSKFGYTKKVLKYYKAFGGDV